MCAWLTLGLVQMWAGETVDGLLSFAEASKLYPNDPEPHILAGKYSENNNPERAAIDIQEGARMGSNVAGCVSGLGPYLRTPEELCGS